MSFSKKYPRKDAPVFLKKTGKGVNVMKHLFFSTVLLLVSVMCLSASDFQPTVMTITCPEHIRYDFNGEPLTIPFTLGGVSGAVWLVINTHGQAENIVNVRNGYLGWHYVNKIDTTVYVSQRYERGTGEMEIVWDGRNQDGNEVEPGTYDYYLWGYDDKSNRLPVCDFIPIGFGRGMDRFNHLYQEGEDGTPLARPLIMGAVLWWEWEVYPEIPWKKYGVHYKWEIGGDPSDSNLLQTTLCSIYNHGISNTSSISPDWIGYGCPVLDPHEFSTFYHPGIKYFTVQESNPFTGTQTFDVRFFTLLKWRFIQDGEAVLDDDWMGWSDYMQRINEGSNVAFVSCFTDRNYIYVMNSCRGSGGGDDNGLLNCFSFDRDVVFERVMHEWYMLEELREIVLEYDDLGNPILFAGGDPNADFKKMSPAGNNRWLLMADNNCMHYMVNTSRLLEDPYDDTDLIVFENRNGDYFLDVAYAPNSEPAWFCVAPGGLTKDYTMNRDEICIDANGFNIFYVSNLGINSFGVSTQDGTGIGYMEFADETITGNTQKGGGQLVDYGSGYDGLYMCGALENASDYYSNHMTTCYIPFDSARGIISDKAVAVEDESPVVFSVSQNSPNPFNPSTTISFTIPQSSHVAIDIYDIAGQKVTTLADEIMTTGTHTARWDASGCASGVYFYKVRAGEFEKTMKMTLIK